MTKGSTSGLEIAEKLINMSLVGNLRIYRKTSLRKDQLFSHTKIGIKKQLEDFRWVLAGYYHRPVGAICSNSTIDQIIKLLPETKSDYAQIEGFNRAHFVLWNHLDEINEIISPLRVFVREKRTIVEQVT